VKLDDDLRKLINELSEVFVLCKDEPSESNTEYAQGGIAVALSDEDEVRLHFEDTIKAGDGLCNEEAVRILVSEGPRYITELIAWGTEFDREGTKLAFTKEAAHSRRRILHAHGDSTGKEIVRALLKKAKTIKNIKFLPRSYTIELITVDGRCLGVSYIDEKSGKRYLLCSRAVRSRNTWDAPVLLISVIIALLTTSRGASSA